MRHMEVSGLLSLGRKPGEYVVIGKDIVIQVLSVDGDLRLAIDAPRELPIVRGEVYEKTQPAPSCVEQSRWRRIRNTGQKQV